MPEIYKLIKAANILQVAPWELAEKGITWMNEALNYAKVESTEPERVRQQREKAARPKKPKGSSIRRI